MKPADRPVGVRLLGLSAPPRSPSSAALWLASGADTAKEGHLCTFLCKPRTPRRAYTATVNPARRQTPRSAHRATATDPHPVP